MSEPSIEIRRLGVRSDCRYFVGGSDARIIMGNDEDALVRLWREKRGEAEPDNLSGNLIVQLGLVTEHLNRHWYERNTGQVIKDVQSWVGAVWKAASPLASSESSRRGPASTRSGSSI